MSDDDENISHADLDWLIGQGLARENPPGSGMWEMLEGWQAALLAHIKGAEA